MKRKVIDVDKGITGYVILISAMCKEASPQPENRDTRTPQQLNAELRAIVDYLPKTTDEEDWNSDTFFEDMITKWEKRETSEYTTKVGQRVSALVQRAPITDHFRKYIVEKFTGHVVIEGPMPQDFFESEFFFLDPDHPESAGVFEPKNAERFERVALAKKVYETRWEEEGLEKLMKKAGQPLESAKSIYAQRWAELNDWREAISHHYGHDSTPQQPPASTSRPEK
jgi:hypothetical protein